MNLSRITDEHAFNRALSRDMQRLGVYAWKINARFQPGVPDFYLSGAGGDCWVECKWEGKRKEHYLPALSDRQREWLDARHTEGRTVFALIGTPWGVLVFPGALIHKPLTLANAITAPQLLEQFGALLCGSTHARPKDACSPESRPGKDSISQPRRTRATPCSKTSTSRSMTPKPRSTTSSNDSPAGRDIQ